MIQNWAECPGCMRWMRCHPEGPRQAGELCRRESHEVPQREMPSPAPGEEQHQVPTHTGGQLAKNQLCRERPGGTGEQVDHEPTTCPCSKEVQEHPGMHYAEYCQHVEGSGASSLLSPHETQLESSIQFWVPKSKTWTYWSKSSNSPQR